MASVLFANVSAARLDDIVRACSHMPYRLWTEPDPKEPTCFRVMCDKTEGRDASGDAGGARPRPQARAATRGPGSNPGRSTITSLVKLFGSRGA